jgi:hypothetical protein
MLGCISQEHGLANRGFGTAAGRSYETRPASSAASASEQRADGKSLRTLSTLSDRPRARRSASFVAPWRGGVPVFRRRVSPVHFTVINSTPIVAISLTAERVPATYRQRLRGTPWL